MQQIIETRQIGCRALFTSDEGSDYLPNGACIAPKLVPSLQQHQQHDHNHRHHDDRIRPMQLQIVYPCFEALPHAHAFFSKAKGTDGWDQGWAFVGHAGLS